MATTWETHALNHNVDELTKHTFKSFRTTLTSSKSTPRSFNAKESVVSPTRTPMKRGAVVHRSAMGKRSYPNGDSAKITSPPRTVKRKVDFDSQLEHIVDSGSGLNSPIAISNTKTSNFSPSASSNSSAIVTPSKTPASKSQKDAYGERTNAGDFIVTYNPNNLDPISNTTTAEITKPFGTLEQYKYMTDKDRSSALNSLLTSFQTKICAQEKERMVNNQRQEMEESEESIMENVGVPRQASQFNVGRICNEAHEGKMNKTTILLEGSTHGSNGARISLDVSKMDKSFSLFSGQIVGVRGVNSSGRKMVVQEIIEGIDTRVVQGVKEDLKQSYQSTDGNGAKIFAVAGPYTTNQNLDYEPFTDLLNLVVLEKPAAVIMMGPFVDLRQQLMKDGDQVMLEYEQEEGGTVMKHVSYETLFAAKISTELEQLFDECPDLKTKFILVPSLDDAVSEPVFPQPPIEDILPDGGKVMDEIEETLEIPFGSLCLQTIETAGNRKQPKEASERRVHLVSNPSTIKINNVTIGLTSTDTLLHLSTEELNQKLPPGTRICRLAEHFIQQQSYYPIFPAPSLPGMKVNLDVNKRSGYSMPVQPDILLLPSRLACLTKDIIGGTVVVNPGHLVKGAMGGSFAVIDVHPMKREQNGGEDVINNVKDRIRVEIKRI